MLKRIPYLVIIVVTGLSLGWMATGPAQPPPGQKADKKGKDKKGDDIARFEDRLQRLRWQFAQPEADPERRTLLTWSGSYTNSAEQIWRTGQPYIADRTLAGAEALVRACDHLEHLKNPPGTPPPPAEAVSRHLADVYFRTREADYFLQEIHDSSASPLVSLARQYYQRAVESYDRSDFRAADEYGKMAEELVRALESLAQAATLAPQPRR
jgi:hypothetical protein